MVASKIKNCCKKQASHQIFMKFSANVLNKYQIEFRMFKSYNTTQIENSVYCKPHKLQVEPCPPQFNVEQDQVHLERAFGEVTEIVYSYNKVRKGFIVDVFLINTP